MLAHIYVVLSICRPLESAYGPKKRLPPLRPERQMLESGNLNPFKSATDRAYSRVAYIRTLLSLTKVFRPTLLPNRQPMMEQCIPSQPEHNAPTRTFDSTRQPRAKARTIFLKIKHFVVSIAKRVFRIALLLSTGYNSTTTQRK